VTDEEKGEEVDEEGDLVNPTVTDLTIPGLGVEEVHHRIQENVAAHITTSYHLVDFR